MYADVILHRRVPSKFDTFTYAVPSSMELAPGQLVEVPFRKQRLAAVVRRLHSENPAYPTRVIETAHALLLADWQMEFASWMSQKYECGFSKVIDLFVPEKIWQGTSVASATIQLRRRSRIHIFSQTLFLYPDLFSLRKFSKNRAVYHGELPEKQKAEIWQKIYNGEIAEICGTRASLFLPFKNLKKIVLNFEENDSYQEKRTPKYDALEIAERIAEIWRIPLVLETSAPRIATWNKYKTEISLSKNDCRISMIDMRDEKRKGNPGIFAEKTVERVAAALAEARQVLLFVNRKGQATALFCQDCREAVRCRSCSLPFTVHGEGHLYCHRCRIEKSIPATCSACHSLRLTNLGAGTERLESEIKKIFGKARVLRLDRETSKKGFDESSLDQPDIIVATQIIEKPLSLPRLALTVAVQADTLLIGSDFRIHERAWQLLTHLKNFTKEEFIIQTVLPEHRLFQLFSQNKMEEFYEEELNIRKSLSLPPFGKM